MKPQKQSVPINFSGGLDLKNDPWQVGPASFLSLNNSIFTTGGRLTKRNGYGAKSTNILTGLSYAFQAFGANVANGSFTSTYQNELTMGDGKNLFSYSERDTEWVYKGRLDSNRVAVAPVYQNQYHQILADSAINLTSAHTLYAWEQWTRIPDLDGVYRGLYYSLVDNVTGLQLFDAFLANTNTRPKCVAIGSNLYLVVYDSSVTSLIGYPITATGIGAPTVLANDINTATTNYDLMVNNSLLYIAYCGTGTTVKVKSFNAALALQATVSKAGETATNGIGVFPGATNNVWAAYNNGSATKAFIMDSTLTTTILAPVIVDNGSTATNVMNVTGCYDGTRGIIFYDQQGVPALAQRSALHTDADYVQPAVGSSVTVSFDVDPLQYLGTIIFIANGGYYYVEGYVLADLLLKNLGYFGNAAPGTLITAGKALYPTAGYINALITYNTLTVVGVVGMPTNFMRSVALNSRAFVQDNIAHVIASYGSNVQPTYFLCSLYNINSSVSPIGNVSSKVFHAVSGGIPYRSILPSVSIDAAGLYNVALPKRIYSIAKTSGNVEFLIWFNGIFNVSFDLSPTEVSSQELGKALLVASGTVMMYDGQNVTEQGFHVDPENVTSEVTGTGMLSAGQYGYQVVYQWIDANGQIYTSAPSAILSITVAANDQVTLTIPTLRVTSKLDATVTVYRTQANLSIYYRLDVERIAPGFYPVNNDITVDTISYVDGIADSQIIGNQQIYTTGEIEDVGPPCSSIITNFRERAILLPSDSPNSFWYSKQIVPGSPIEFNDTFIQNVDSVGGVIISMAPMDDKLILYKRASIYYMTGSGPAPSGTNNDFAEPLLVTTDCGAIDRTSIVQMPMGHMFKSEKGIYLLDRSLQAEYIGAGVEAYNQYSVLSAKLIAGTTQVRFALSSGDTLMYDYFYKQWAVFTGLGMISDCIYQRLQTYVKADGSVYQETPGAYLDGVTPVLMSFTTAWIKLAGLQGYQRAFFFYLLGEYISAHQLGISLYTNFSAVADQTDTITPNSANFLENWRVFFKNQRCQSFQIAIQEIYGGTPGAALTMSGLNLIVGVKSSFRTISAAQTAG